MAFPVDNTLVNLTGTFGPRKRIWIPSQGVYSGGYHYGMDFAPEVRGTLLPVYAIRSGVVTYVGTRKDAGNEVRAYFPSIRRWGRYCHLHGYSVRAGQAIADAQYLGRMGATGNATGVHLHFEIYTDAALTNRENPHKWIWSERNPVSYPINGTEKPAPKPVPKPTPPAVSTPTLGVGAKVKLTNWATYHDQGLTDRREGQNITGTYTIVGIYSGSLHVQDSKGGRTFVHISAKAGLIASAPSVSKPAPKPAPKPVPAKTVKVNAKIRLSTPWNRYRYADFNNRGPAMQPHQLPPGVYTVAAVQGGAALLKGTHNGKGISGWVVNNSNLRKGVL